MADDLNPQWERHFEGIAGELLNLAIACNVRLREPGAIERVLRNDITVCGRKDKDSFRKMRSVGKAVDRIGPEDTRRIVDAITDRKMKLRDSGGK
jgi:hypothetical protein